ncbi:MAG: acetyl-CoA C-acyltransferase [Opitutaceae bacterium]|nr:acetyl-CoA C-acyltransferase [Opitutaceae bacterium]|tara:strand:+ start:479 stop:1669 length:1191 start_codon:yes stop_codon:yes gene_type:complete
MKEAVLVATARTPLAKSFRGSLNMTRPDDMVAHCLNACLEKTPDLDPVDIEDVIIGCATPEGQQGSNVARIATVRAGLPHSIAATTVNRFCSSGLQSVAMAAHHIMAQGADVAIGGGVESITAIRNSKRDPNPWVEDNVPGVYMVMGDTAEVVAKRYQISREEQDEYSLASQQRTAKAQADGLLDEELAPMHVTRAILDKKTGEVVDTEEHDLVRDECNRPDTTLEGLLGLNPYFDRESGEGSVTPGNASQMSDGASINLLMSREKAESLGLKPKIAFRGFAVAGCEPDEMGIGPVYAVPKLLKRNGLTINDIGLWELNEAFAVQVVYCRDQLGIPVDRLNVNGGSISIGHPFGMTGARLVGTISNEMQRRRVKYGVVTMCIGGGQGAAGLFELCE